MAQAVIPKEKLNYNSCRICLESQYPSSVKIKKDLLKIMVKCFGIQVNNGPLILCTNCAVYIVKYNDFRQKVISSNDLWNSYPQECDILKQPLKKQPKEEIEIKCEVESDIDNSEIVVLSDRESDHITVEEDQNKHLDANEAKELSTEKVETTCWTQDATISAILEKYSKCKILKAKKGRRSKFICERCDKGYKRAEYLLRHQEVCDVIKEKEPVKTNICYDCGLCPMRSYNREEINAHVAEHCAKNDLGCAICGFQGTDFAEMEGHRYKHHEKKATNSKTCHVCNKVCIATMSLIYHFRTVHMKMKGSSCRHCNKFIKTYKGWKRHELLHTTYNFICDICGQKFIQRNTIVEHMKKHYNVKEHVCHVCGKAFSRLSYLRVHISTVHTSQEPVKCSHCNRDYKSQFHLDQHIKEINQSKPFQCEHCLKFFATETRLKNHLFWHSGERPFACDICSATYKAKSTLKLHIREVHSSYRPFKCKICEKGFLTHQRLRRHISMHTGVRKFKCLYCDRSFHSNSLLNAHCSSQHKTVTEQQSL